MSWTRIAGEMNGYPSWPTIDSTGANRLTAVVMGFGSSGGSMVDSKSNTWTARTLYASGGNYIQIFDCLSPTSVGSSHQLSTDQGASFSGALFFHSWSSSAGSDAFQEDGHQFDGLPDFHQYATSAGITPSDDGAFFLAAASILGGNGASWSCDLSFSTDSTSFGYGMLSYKNQATAASQRPLLDWTNSSNHRCAMAVYVPSGGGGSSVVPIFTQHRHRR